MKKFLAAAIEERQQMFIDWVKGQPPEKEYDYMNCGQCPLAQFGRSVGFSRANAGSHDFEDMTMARHDVLIGNPLSTLLAPEKENPHALALAHSKTFGELATKLV